MRIAPDAPQFDRLENMFATIFVENSDGAVAGFRNEEWRRVVVYPDKYMLESDHLAGLATALGSIGRPELFFYYRECEGESTSRARGMYSFDDYVTYEDEPPPHAVNCIFSVDGSWGIHFSLVGSVAAGPPDLLSQWECAFGDTWEDQERGFVEGAARLFAEDDASRAHVQEFLRAFLCR